MKKILLIQSSPAKVLGGTQTYNNHLIKILTKYFPSVLIDQCVIYDVFEKYMNEFNTFFVHDNFVKKDSNNPIYLFNHMLHLLRFRKLVYSLNKKNNYDLILDSTYITFKHFFQKNNYFWIQHNDFKFYSLELIHNKFWRFLKKILFHLIGIKNNLMYVKNIVLFDYCNYDKVKSIRMTTFNPYIIELSNIVPFNLKNDLIRDIKNRNRIIYFGRINNEQKNINLLNQINHYLKLIDFYGNGNENLIKELGESYKGYIDSSNKLKDLFAKYKYMILMSNYEGFPYSLVQSLCYGLPIIVLDTFASATFFVNKNKNGFLLRPNENISEYVEQINNIYKINDEKFLQLSLNSYKFAQENLSEEQFEEKWLKIFNKYLK